MEVSADICLLCMQSFKGPSAKKDLPVCQSCFKAQFEHEKQTIRKKRFEEADFIIDNLYLGPESSASELQYLKDKNITGIIVAADYCDKWFTADGHGINYLELKIDDSPDENLAIYFDQVIEFILKR
jgi:hypothetical protein